MELIAKSLFPDSHYSMDYYCLLQSWKHPRLGQTSWGKGCRVDLMASQWVRTQIHILSFSLSPSLTASPSKNTWELCVWQTMPKRSDCAIKHFLFGSVQGWGRTRRHHSQSLSNAPRATVVMPAWKRGLQMCVLETSLPCLADPETDHS